MLTSLKLTTQALDPDRATWLQTLPPSLRQQLPIDYVEFIQACGEGTYAGEVVITYPDVENIGATFGEYTDLWELTATYTEADLRNSVQVASSANGDILCVTAAHLGRVFLLPRHAEHVSSWPSFFAAATQLLPAQQEIYFDPAFEAVYAQISLAGDNYLLAIESVRQAFLQQYGYDFAVKELVQPKYIIQAIGGWVSFDLVYKHSITVKYQQRYATAAEALLVFLRQQLA